MLYWKLEQASLTFSLTFTGELCTLTRFGLEEILRLAGTAGAVRIARHTFLVMDMDAMDPDTIVW